MTQTHTPTPWVLRSGMSSGHWICNGNSDSLYERLAIVDLAPTEEGSEAAGQANAEFIVRACNTHEGLVRAMEDLLHHIPVEYNNHGEPIDQELATAMSMAEIALAKARGEADNA